MEDIESELYQNRNHAQNTEAWRCVLSFFESEGRWAHVVALPLVAKGKGVIKEMIGEDRGITKRSGIYVLQSYFDCADIVVVPQASLLLDAHEHEAFYAKLLAMTESWEHFFVIVDFPSKSNTQRVIELASRLHSSLAAAYHPWLIKDDCLLPPGPMVAAAYQINDQAHNINDLPANRVLSTKLIPLISLRPCELHDCLQARVNVVHRFANQQLRIWGGRTLSASNEKNLKFISSSRTLLAVREAVHQICEPYVFQPTSADVTYEMKRELAEFGQSVTRIFDPAAKLPFYADASVSAEGGQDMFIIDIRFSVPHSVDQLSFSLGLTG